MSWEQLRSIAFAQAEYDAFWRGQLPRFCPYDMTQLQSSPPGADSELFCPSDGWRYPQDWDVNTMAGM